MEYQFEAFVQTSLAITAAMCVLAVLVAWYTVRNRIQLSQIILGVFSYVLVMLLENVLDTVAVMSGVPNGGLVYGLYITLSVVIAREVIRLSAMHFGVKSNFDNTDAAVGFAIGFAGVYMGVCAAYYFNCYTLVTEYMTNGADAFWANVGTDAEEAGSLLEMVASQDGWAFILTGLNRVCFMVREVALSVLLWYAMDDKGDRKIYFLLVPLMHFMTMIPDGIYQAELLNNVYVKDILTCVLTAGVAYVAAREYNKRENLVAHFKVEKLRARKRR